MRIRGSKLRGVGMVAILLVVHIKEVVNTYIKVLVKPRVSSNWGVTLNNS